MAEDNSLLAIRKRANEIKDMYAHKRNNNTFSALVMGLRGHGKTSLIATGRKPILIDSFDPNGTVVLERTHSEDIKNGNIIIRQFWSDRYSKPMAYKEWSAQWEKDVTSGFFNHLGTYAIDSYTTFQDAIASHLGLQGKSSKLPHGALAQSDYQPLYGIVKDTIKISSSFNCDFILTAHVLPARNELTDEITIDIDAFSRMKSAIPILFTEKYVMLVQPGREQNKHYILTRDYGKYVASTQLGAGGVFDLKEEPNIKTLLKKVGIDPSDKPSLFV